MESTIVTAEQLKQFTSIGQNIDCELLNPHLLISQQLYCEPVMGTALYNDIISRYNNNALTGNTQTLYEDYVVPAIGYGAWYSVAPFLNYKTQRAGIQTTSSADSTPVTPEELSLYITRVDNFKDFYLERLRAYLYDNQSLFPLYRSADSQPVSKGGGIYLGYRNKYNSNLCCDD